MSDRYPTLATVLKRAIASERRTMFGGWMPGRIETYDPTKNKASVQLLLLEPFETESGEKRTEALPIITEVPVMTFGDGTGIRIDLPELKRGDYVLVLFGARSVDRWVQIGGMVDPGDARDHDMNDAVCLPGLFDFGHVNKPAARITFTSSQVQAGGTSSLALLSELASLVSKMHTILSALKVYTAGIQGVADPTDVFTTTFNGVVTTNDPTAPTGTTVLKGA